MAKKIKVVRYIHAHYLAGCNDCDFSAGRNTDAMPEPKDVISAVRKHVLKTGHECWIEAATHTVYSIADPY